MEVTGAWLDSDSDSYEKKLTEEGRFRGERESNKNEVQPSHSDEKLPPDALRETGSGTFMSGGQGSKSPRTFQREPEERCESAMSVEDGSGKSPNRREQSAMEVETRLGAAVVPRLHQEVSLGEWIARAKAARRVWRARYARGRDDRYGIYRRERYAARWGGGARGWRGQQRR